MTPLLIDRHPMPFQDKEVAGIIENVYSKFKLMLIKKDEPSKVNKATTAYQMKRKSALN